MSIMLHNEKLQTIYLTTFTLYSMYSYTKPFVYRNPLSTKTLCLLRDPMSRNPLSTKTLCLLRDPMSHPNNT